jgi:hypothetical protein
MSDELKARLEDLKSQAEAREDPLLSGIVQLLTDILEDGLGGGGQAPEFVAEKLPSEEDLTKLKKSPHGEIRVVSEESAPVDRHLPPLPPPPVPSTEDED